MHRPERGRTAIGARSERSAAGPGRPMKILIVDDEPGIRLTVAAAVERFGHRALQASDGAEALSAFQLFRPEVVITDWSMPEMSGTELAARIRSIEASYTYIMVLTGAADETAAREAVQL